MLFRSLDALRRKVVLVKIDETRGHHKASGIDNALARERLLTDSDDLAVTDAYIANRVKRGFRIDDAAVVEDEIVLGLAEGNRGASEASENDKNDRNLLSEHVRECTPCTQGIEDQSCVAGLSRLACALVYARRKESAHATRSQGLYE